MGLLSKDCRGSHGFQGELRGDQLSLTEYKGGEDYILLPAGKGVGWDKNTSEP